MEYRSDLRTLLIMAIILMPVPAFTSIALLNNKAIAISNKTIKSTISSNGCTSSLWNFIANPPGRFNIINRCVTVTGTVLSINPQPDGDTDFPLALDPPYKNMVTKANFNPVMQGGIWSEHPETSSEVQPFKRGECNGFNGPLFNVPQVRQHIRVTGTYLLDLREDGHAEIHPVSSIELIK
ncbi:MAG TPA: hypothetical protein VFI70_08910 [Nitrososphaeraceae archaeon]|nr:hypothetical protein [Nitrososphaeraceae archaeon]